MNAAPLQMLLREELDAIRAKQWAESCARVFTPTADEARAHVRMLHRTPAQAFAVCRREYESLRAGYFGKRSAWGTSEATERDWTEHGPESEYKALYAEFFPSSKAEGRTA